MTHTIAQTRLANQRHGRPRLSGPVGDLARVMQCLGAVVDPATGENIVELGLVERVRLEPGRAELVLVTSSASCPLSDLVADEAFRALQRALPDTDLYVTYDLDTEWSPDRVSAGARGRLGWTPA